MKEIDQIFKEIIFSKEAKKFIDKIYLEENVVPEKKNVFRAFNFFEISQTKVVILGQDPYPGKNVADGLAFSTKNKKTPASLLNIFQELKKEYPNIQIKSNSLTNWAQQGVLLINTILTTKQGISLAHKHIGWKEFTMKIINFINNNLENIIFVLWGGEAKKWKKYINLNKHHVLTSSHPSPLSANKGFFGCNHFIKINEILEKLNKKAIDWSTY